MKLRHVIGALIVLVAMCTMTLLGCLGHRISSARFNFHSLVDELKSGDIADGTPVRQALGLGKPIAEASRTDASVDGGVRFGLLAYSFDYEVLHLYTADGEIYAAQHIHGVSGGTPAERWYFCNVELLSRHVALALEESQEPVDDERR